MAERKTIAVVGGGSAGFTAARTAAGAGARVLFFMGNEAAEASLCVNHGCMPSKAMFAPIDAMHHARRHGWLRVEPRRPDDYLAQVVAWKDREIARFRAYRQRAIRNKDSEDFRVIRHAARFVEPGVLEAAGERYSADAVILATGSTPSVPPIEGLADRVGEVWTSREMLANTVLPESLAVIGAGAIGLELALRYARLGSAVTVVARSSLLSGYPARFGERLARIYEREGIRVLCDASTRRVSRDHRGWFIVQVDGPDGIEPVVAERVLLAVGRRPAVDGLGLDAAGIATNRRGGLDVGEDMRVEGHERVFAAGDVIGRRAVVHQAHIEAGIAARNAVTEGDSGWDRRANLQVVFTDPEFAYAGVDVAAAEADGHEVITASKDSRLVGKLHLGGDDLGFAEVIADARDGRILGAGMLCEGASDLIHLPAYLIEHGNTVHDAARAEFYHPTRAEILSSLFDDLCERLDETPPCRADE